MDRITKNYLDAFRKEQSFNDDLPDSEVFEHFANYCVVSDAYDDEFDVTDVHTGGRDDLGLDGVAIIVNGMLVDSVEEVRDLLEINGTLDATFIFVQAKTGSSFSAGEIGAFFDGVDEFFKEGLTLPLNDSVANSRAVMQTIYENSIRFTRTKPSCRLHYVTTGQWVNDSYITIKAEKWAADLRGTGLFSTVAFTPMGADEIHAAYQRSKNSVTTEFQFSARVLLPDIEGVSEAWLGVLPSDEFLKLITDDLGNIRKPLFTDNVRDFQGANAVNSEIQKTLRDDKARGRFVVLNNGVTIVARDLRLTRDRVTMSDYQIVNGCQTSHVLFDEREALNSDVQVPVKIISTQDEDAINAIITATNRQTQVTAEDLLARGAFAKKLESFLRSFDTEKSLYYERRSKQYNSEAGVEKVRIITKSQLIRAFAAMFLDEPHRANSYYSELYSQAGNRIFGPRHKLEPYYTAAYAHYKLEFMFRNGGLGVDYKPARYHLIMALRYIVGGRDEPDLAANRIRPYCNTIWEVLWDRGKATQTFRMAAEIIDIAAGSNELSRDLVKTRAFTDSVKKALDRGAQ